jgi:hypothetical protein
MRNGVEAGLYEEHRLYIDTVGVLYLFSRGHDLDD